VPDSLQPRLWKPDVFSSIILLTWHNHTNIHTNYFSHKILSAVEAMEGMNCGNIRQLEGIWTSLMLHNTVRCPRSPQSIFPLSSRSPLSHSISRLAANDVAASFNYLSKALLVHYSLTHIQEWLTFLARRLLIISPSRNIAPRFILTSRFYFKTEHQSQ
jgi:hypothetical protein